MTRRTSRKATDSYIDEAGWVYQPQYGGRWLAGHMKAWCKQKRAMDMAEYHAEQNRKQAVRHKRWVNYIKMVQAESLKGYLNDRKRKCDVEGYSTFNVCEITPQYEAVKRLMGVPLIIEEC